MRTSIFRCPATGQKVQGWFSDDGSNTDDESYETVACTACRSIHLVNPVTGKTLGSSDE
jgi:hypothetical protein